MGVCESCEEVGDKWGIACFAFIPSSLYFFILHIIYTLLGRNTVYSSLQDNDMFFSSFARAFENMATYCHFYFARTRKI